MSQTADRRADTARAPLVRAAAHQFARKPYGLVNVDDVVAAVEVSRGAMYFHFPSKQALAVAVIDESERFVSAAFADVLANNLSGLETLIDLFYLLAVLDSTEDLTRAGMNLLESVGRAEGLKAKMMTDVIDNLSRICARAITEGDIADGHQPQDITRVLVATYIGLRHTSDLDDPRRFLTDLETAWNLLLPGFAKTDRMAYWRLFVGRRTAVALRKLSGSEVT